MLVFATRLSCPCAVPTLASICLRGRQQKFMYGCTWHQWLEFSDITIIPWVAPWIGNSFQLVMIFMFLAFTLMTRTGLPTDADMYEWFSSRLHAEIRGINSNGKSKNHPSLTQPPILHNFYRGWNLESQGIAIGKFKGTLISVSGIFKNTKNMFDFLKISKREKYIKNNKILILL